MNTRRGAIIRSKLADPGSPATVNPYADSLLERITGIAERRQAKTALEKLKKHRIDTENLCSSLMAAVDLPRLRKTDVLHSHSAEGRRQIRNLPKTLKQLSELVERNQLPELLRTAFFFSRAQNRNTLAEIYQKCGDGVTIEKNRKYGDLFLCLPNLLQQVGEDLKQLLRNPGAGVMDFSSQITWICGEVKKQSEGPHYSEISDLLRPLQRLAGQPELDADALKMVVMRDRAKNRKLVQMVPRRK
jgi:hypothetical protein